jgi:hypothetical protein
LSPESSSKGCRKTSFAAREVRFDRDFESTFEGSGTLVESGKVFDSTSRWLLKDIGRATRADLVYATDAN